MITFLKFQDLVVVSAGQYKSAIVPWGCTRLSALHTRAAAHYAGSYGGGLVYLACVKRASYGDNHEASFGMFPTQAARVLKYQLGTLCMAYETWSFYIPCWGIELENCGDALISAWMKHDNQLSIFLSIRTEHGQSS